MRNLLARRPPPSRPRSQLVVELTGVVWPEGTQWVSQCIEFDISSFGASPGDAIEELKDAVCSYLNTIEDLGERERVFEERGVPVYQQLPSTVQSRTPRALLDRPGAMIRPFDVPIGGGSLALA